MSSADPRSAHQWNAVGRFAPCRTVVTRGIGHRVDRDGSLGGCAGLGLGLELGRGFGLLGGRALVEDRRRDRDELQPVPAVLADGADSALRPRPDGGATRR